MGDCISIESGGLVGREESYATSLNTRSYMEPRCDSETGELGRDPIVSVVACDQRCVLGTVTAVWFRIVAVEERSSCGGGGSKCVGVRLKRFFFGRLEGCTFGTFLLALRS
jgi:hypothetical protein